jgi:hypothetical protein
MAAKRGSDATAHEDQLIADIIKSRGENSREEATVSLELARSSAELNSLEALPRFEAAWKIFASQLGEGSSICRVIANDAHTAAHHAANPESQTLWRKRIKDPPPPSPT